MSQLMQAIIDTLKKPNNDQIKHLSQAFRIVGVAGFLGMVTQADKTAWQVAGLVIGWVVFECCAIITLRFVTETSK